MQAEKKLLIYKYSKDTKIHYIDILEYIIYKVNIANKLVKIVSC